MGQEYPHKFYIQIVFALKSVEITLLKNVLMIHILIHQHI